MEHVAQPNGPPEPENQAEKPLTKPNHLKTYQALIKCGLVPKQAYGLLGDGKAEPQPDVIARPPDEKTTDKELEIHKLTQALRAWSCERVQWLLNEIVLPFDDTDDTGELTFQDKARKIISILEPDELDSIAETLQEKRVSGNSTSFMLSGKLKGNASLALMLIASLWHKNEASDEGGA